MNIYNKLTPDQSARLQQFQAHDAGLIEPKRKPSTLEDRLSRKAVLQSLNGLRLKDDGELLVFGAGS